MTLDDREVKKGINLWFKRPGTMIQREGNVVDINEHCRAVKLRFRMSGKGESCVWMPLADCRWEKEVPKAA